MEKLISLLKWLEEFKETPESRRVFLKRGAIAGGVALLGMAGYKNDEARDLLLNGKRRLEAFLKPQKSQKRTSPAKKHSPPEPIPNESEYREFLSTLNLRYFSEEEIIRPHRNYRNGVRNNIPPKSLWNEIIPTLRLADRLRADLGVRVTILSVYRSPDYNTAIGGASRSQHMRNIAIDLKFACDSDLAFEAARKLREDGEFSGGVGWYPSFIHVDTRGYDATWGKV